jgi:alpha-L-fucosidase
VHDFIDIVSKNGQLLLNVSPKSDGSIPEDQKAVLRALGAWLKSNGEAIYGTRPWKIYGEGPTQMKDDGHGSAHVDYTPEDIRFTAKGEAIYAIALGTPRESLTIVALALNDSLVEPPITSVTSLNGDYIESWIQEHDGLKIRLQKDAPEQLAYAFKVL